jgi:hypothetical protein
MARMKSSTMIEHAPNHKGQASQRGTVLPKSQKDKK